MMLYPAMKDLLAKVPSRYELVNVVACRARQISNEAEQAGEHLRISPSPSLCMRWPTASWRSRTLSCDPRSKPEVPPLSLLCFVCIRSGGPEHGEIGGENSGLEGRVCH